MDPGLGPGPQPCGGRAHSAPWWPGLHPGGRGRGSGAAEALGGGAVGGRRGQLGGLCTLSSSSHTRCCTDHLLNTHVYACVRTPEEPGADPRAGDAAGNPTDLAPALGSLESKLGG